MIAMSCSRINAAKDLGDLVHKLSADSLLIHQNSESIRLLISLSGTLIFASPHAVDGGKSALGFALGTNVAERLWNSAGFTEDFQVFFVAKNGGILAERWRNPAVAFNRLFIVDCESGDYLRFVVRSQILHDIVVDRQKLR
jgi:hypothetical protein